MSQALERQVIAQVLATYIGSPPYTGILPSVPVAWPNKVFEKPVSGPWMRFSVVDVQTKQLETGSANDTQRRYGSLVLQMFWPADQGDGDLLAMGDVIGNLYRQQRLDFPDSPSSGMVRMRNPVVKTVGRDGEYWQANLIVPFHCDELPPMPPQPSP